MRSRPSPGFVVSILALHERGQGRAYPAQGVDVAVTDTRVLDVDDYVVIVRRATLDEERLQLLVGASDAVRLDSGGHLCCRELEEE